MVEKHVLGMLRSTADSDLNHVECSVSTYVPCLRHLCYLAFVFIPLFHSAHWLFARMCVQVFLCVTFVFVCVCVCLLLAAQDCRYSGTSVEIKQT